MSSCLTSRSIFQTWRFLGVEPILSSESWTGRVYDLCVYFMTGTPEVVYGEAGKRACDPWITRYRFIPYTMARNRLIKRLTELMCSQICLVIYPGMQRIMCNIYSRIINYKLLSYMNPVHHVKNVLLCCNASIIRNLN